LPASKPTGERGERYLLLRLYVTGSTPNSLHALQNLRRMLDEHAPGGYRLEVIDIYQHPERAREAQLLAAPTLVKEQPLPVRRLIGNMSDESRVLRGLDVKGAARK
jgi:circadian clock protein KaiB